MKRIAITLILSVIVFVTTILVSITYISRKGLQTADYLNNLALDNFQHELNSKIRLTEQSARNFLTGIPSVHVGSDSTCIFIDEDRLYEFKDMIHEILLNFMSVNKYYQSSMFVIDGDICRKYFRDEGAAAYGQHRTRGYIPYVYQGENTLYDLSCQYDIMSHSQYQQIKHSRKILWTTPWSISDEEGRSLTLNVPLTLSNGLFFGVFALSLDVSTINENLKVFLPFGEEKSAIFIVDENDHIFASYPEWIMEPECQKAIRESTDLLQRHDTATEHSIIEFEEKECYVYQRDQLLLPWRIITVNRSDAIYQDARHVVNAIILSSITGMCLMLVCCMVIFSQIRKNLRRKAAAEEELRMAAMVQTSILKPAAFTLPGQSTPLTLHAFMRPAKEAGGDLYDYVEKDGKLLFCIGDVSGKGMAAALFMTQVISLFRNAVRYTSEPSEIAVQINSVLAAGNSEMTFCTLFIGVFCEDEMTFCNAGHNPPVFIPALSRSSFLKVQPNLAIGLMGTYPYRSETIPFRPGDKLVLYTDGVTEAKDKNRRQYGEERLLSMLDSMLRNPEAPGHRIDTALKQSIGEFVQQAEQSDDITILSIEH